MNGRLPFPSTRPSILNWRGALHKIAGRAAGGRLLILACDDAGGSGEFVWQMEQLAERFKPIRLSRLLWHVGGKKPLAGQQVCVTWRAASRDDGQAALAALRRLQLTATYCPDFESLHAIGNESPIDPTSNWNDLRDIASAGGDIALRLHSRAQVVALPAAQRRAKLALLRQEIEREVGIRVAAFVYASETGDAPAANLIHDAALAGYSLGVTVSGGVNALRPFAPLMLTRETIAADTPRHRYLRLLDSFAQDQ
jgi:hypothetical protein